MRSSKPLRLERLLLRGCRRNYPTFEEFVIMLGTLVISTAYRG